MQNNLEDNNSEQIQSVSPAPRQLDKSQKIAVAVLAFFACLVIFVWLVQTKRNLSDPFDYNNSTSNQTSTCVDGNCGGASEVDLRQRDTDKDGLSDYDELNTYNTSPYLEDSDSDGYGDRQEIESQNDPTCPFGQDCYLIPALPADPANDAFLMDAKEPSIAPTDIGTQINSAEQVLGGQGDVESLRSMLVGSGMDPQVLDQISDAELMSSYQDILAN